MLTMTVDDIQQTQNPAAEVNNDELAGEDETAYRDVESSVHVAVRVRPLLEWEEASGEEKNSHCIQTKKSSPPTISVGRKHFAFDQVFDSSTTQVELYDAVVRKMVQNCLQGFNATILAYGQTGSGKTHTVFGPSPHCYLDETDLDMGIIPRALVDLFQNLKENTANDNKNSSSYQVQLQFLELYGEEIRDLLNPQPHHTKLTIRDYEDEPEVLGAVQIPVESPQQAWQVLSHGLLRRVTGATAMNESSSRSHAILTVILEQQQKKKPSTSSEMVIVEEDDEEQQIQTIRSRFHFVDLAGAERQKRTQAQGQRLEEGISINKGLLTLGNVISALGDPRKRGKTHVPYRESKLTRILRGSLGGNHKTYMIACVSPAAANFQESLNCLKYANRAKNIQNKAVVNVDNHTKIIHEYQSRISILAAFVLQQQARNENRREEQEEKSEFSSCSALPFPKEILVAWSQGQQNQINNVVSSPQRTPMHHGMINKVNGNNQSSIQQQNLLLETQRELRKTQDLLSQTQTFHEIAEQELAQISAAKQLADLQLSVLLESHVSRDGIDTDDESKENADEKPNTNTKLSRIMESAFAERIRDYETELREVRRALREKETQLKTMQQWNVASKVDVYGAEFKNNDDADLISQTEKALMLDRERLRNIRVSATGAENETLLVSESGETDGTELFEADTSMERWTKKYLGSFDEREKDAHDDDAENEDNMEYLKDDSSFGMRRQRQFQADLEELSRSIASKERTIEKLKQTQKNYVVRKSVNSFVGST